MYKYLHIFAIVNNTNMTIGDLKGWLKAIPDSFDDMTLLYRTYETMQVEKDEKEEFAAIDMPLVGGFLDEENRECCFINETSRTFIVNMNTKLKEKK